MAYTSAYLAGPMRGYPLFNFPAFDEAARRLRKGGWHIISPAEHDKEQGFDEAAATDEFGDSGQLDLAETILWDLKAIARTQAVILLPKWRKSSGVKVEKAMAEFIRHPLFEYKQVGPADDYRIRLLGTKEWE